MQEALPRLTATASQLVVGQKYSMACTIHLIHTLAYANININICSIELKWDGKITKIWNDNEMKWIYE